MVLALWNKLCLLLTKRVYELPSFLYGIGVSVIVMDAWNTATGGQSRSRYGFMDTLQVAQWRYSVSGGYRTFSIRPASQILRVAGSMKKSLLRLMLGSLVFCYGGGVVYTVVWWQHQRNHSSGWPRKHLCGHFQIYKKIHKLPGENNHSCGRRSAPEACEGIT